jgi:hypothetical protein
VQGRQQRLPLQVQERVLTLLPPRQLLRQAPRVLTFPQRARRGPADR